jgi:hypothetical protein
VAEGEFVGLWGLKAARCYKPSKRSSAAGLEVIVSKEKTNNSIYSAL